MLPVRPELIAQLLRAAADLARELRPLLTAVLGRRRPGPSAAYETVSLALVLELEDVRGERAVLRRRQRIRFLGDGGAVVRELLWGEGDQACARRRRRRRHLAGYIPPPRPPSHEADMPYSRGVPPRRGRSGRCR